MTQSLLTHEDIEFLDQLQARLRCAMEFSILRREPIDTDLVLIKNTSIPYLRLSLGKLKFVSLGVLRELCENLVQQSTIHEVWLGYVLENAYRFSKALPEDDALRFIYYFKAHHGIVDESVLAQDAREAINEARKALFGIN
jgi:hypothetical protein